MFGFKRQSPLDTSVAFCLGEKSYSVAAIKNNKEVIFSEYRSFKEKIPELLTKALTEDVERLKIVGQSCRLILAPRQYQLLLMDAPNVPEEEMVKALRWRLKGLVDYPLNDIALDVFLVPPHGVGGQRKKVFVAVTPLSHLKANLALFESAYLEVNTVSIAELALINLVTSHQGMPVMLISREEAHYQMQILYEEQLYLVRELALTQEIIHEETPAAQNFLLEVQRSLDYCLSELKLPSPNQILFTPSFYQEEDLLKFLQRELGKDTKFIDLNHLLTMKAPLNLKDQMDVFFSIAGALEFNIHDDEQS